MCKKIIIVLLICSDQFAMDTIKRIANIGKKIGSTTVVMGEGMGAYFSGSVSGDYIYNFIVYNGSTVPVNVELKNKTKILDATYDGAAYKQMTIQPSSNSSDMYIGCKLLFQIRIPTCKFSENHLALLNRKDKLVYAYHVYETEKGVFAEQLGVLSDSVTALPGSKLIVDNGIALIPDFSGSIYNGLKVGTVLGFKYGNQNIRLFLEPETFHILQSTAGYAIRPSAFEGIKNTLLINTKGFGYVSRLDDPAEKDNSKLPLDKQKDPEISSTPMRYNYEFLPDGKLIETGFGPSHFKQPINGKIRNITPMIFGVWNKSDDVDITDPNTSLSLLPMKNQNLWVYYTGEVYTVKQKIVIKELVEAVPLGSCLQFYGFRPRIADKLSKIYIAIINTTDKGKATKFFRALAAKDVPSYKVKIPDASTISMETIMQNKLPDSTGVIRLDDITGYLVLYNAFSPFSLATGNFFYTASMPLYALGLVFSTFAQFIQFSDPATSTDQQKALWAKLRTWVTTFSEKRVQVALEVEAYITPLVSDDLVTINEANKTKTLNVKGKVALSTLLYGPMSISHMPVLYNTAQIGTPDQPPSTWAAPANVVWF